MLAERTTTRAAEREGMCKRTPLVDCESCGWAGQGEVTATTENIESDIITKLLIIISDNIEMNTRYILVHRTVRAYIARPSNMHTLRQGECLP